MKIHESVNILDGAKVVGNVDIDENSSVWYNAVIRGDHGSIKIGKNTNVQDNATLHGPPVGTTFIGDNVSIGHGAIVHGCQIEDNVLIGMNSTILNRAKIGKNSVVGAAALVTEDKEFPEGSLILGVPAKVIRKLTKEEIEKIKLNADIYVSLAKKHY
ncbi:MAG: gamma carbonic anhydrase family protein [Methanobrevibacter sp.]|jgi:carbonic anhydrase/acetyltransferase-like protein (isoleucine patch superfamily)|nr:gamma carbonic anhydrase family protein [Methanobrevibacter sp.]